MTVELKLTSFLQLLQILRLDVNLGDLPMEPSSPISLKENGERDKSYQIIKKDNAPTENNNSNADGDEN